MPGITGKEQAQRHRAIVESQIPVGSIWKHYKGGIYRVIAISCMENNPDEVLVTYKSDAHGSIWTRTSVNWLES